MGYIWPLYGVFRALIWDIYASRMTTMARPPADKGLLKKKKRKKISLCVSYIQQNVKEEICVINKLFRKNVTFFSNIYIYKGKMCWLSMEKCEYKIIYII